MSCSCGCGDSTKTTLPPVIVHVPGLQGPQGPAGEGGGSTNIVRYDIPQDLSELQQAQARENIGACSLVELSEAQGFTTRFTNLTLSPEGQYSTTILTPSKKVRAGDCVIDAKGRVYQVKKIEDTTFSITAQLAQVGGGVSDYSELTGKPHLGALAGLDTVSAENLEKVIDLGSI